MAASDSKNRPESDPIEPSAPPARELPRAKRLEPDLPPAEPSQSEAVSLPEIQINATPAPPSPSKGKKARRAAKHEPLPATEKPKRSDDGSLIESHDEEEHEDLTTIVVKESPAWLASAVFNMLMLIILALWAMNVNDNSFIHLTATTENLGEQLLRDDPVVGMDDEPLVDDFHFTESELETVPDPLSSPNLLSTTIEGSTMTSDMTTQAVGLDFRGREIGSRRSMLDAYGGNDTTEAAVKAGLAWLARIQLRDGSWSLAGPDANYADAPVGKGYENRPAATAMALLAFQGHGNTPRDGEYKKNVEQAWRWLLEQQDEEGSFFQFGLSNQRFYTHGQCTIALCELYGMTKDSQYRAAAELAVEYCVKTQAREGGWKYDPGIESDTSVTGWVLMGLQSARMAGLEVPDKTFEGIDRFLNSVQLEDGSRYSYDPDKVASVAMTAEALLCRQYRGWRRDDSRLIAGVEWLLRDENRISFTDEERDAYYWYYATQVMHHMEGSHWRRWNEIMRQVLPEQQVKSGREAGSWDPENPVRDKWATWGGRLYVTCLSIYMLEVYYRHLPLYSHKVYSHMGRGIDAEL